MAFFSKRKSFDSDRDSDEEYEDEKYETSLRRRRPRSEEFKDLKSSNKGKRKEPKKPWGKGERIVVLLVILLSVGISGVLALSSRSWKLPGIPRLTFPSFSLPPFFQEETIIIEGRKEDLKKADKTKEAFRQGTEDLSGVYGLYIFRLNNGFAFGGNNSCLVISKFN